MRSRRDLLFFIVVASLLALALVVSAQETPDMVPSTLEEVTGNPDTYRGQTVLIEGYIREFVNVDSFVLHEQAALDDDSILVINNSGTPFPPRFFRGDRVVVTGKVYGSFDMESVTAEGTAEVTPAVEGETVTDEPTEMATAEATETADADAVRVVSFEEYYAGSFPDDYNGFIVIAIDSIDDLELFQAEDEAG